MKCSIIFAVSAELNNFLKMEVLVTLKHLKVTDRPGDVEKCLRKNGVRFLHRLDVIYTNFDALRMQP